MSRPFETEIATIERIGAEMRSVSDNIVVLLVINTKTGTHVENDFDQFSVTSEYFSEAELKELTDGFASIGCEVDHSNGEKEFTERLIRGDFAQYDGQHKLVYHATGSGTGRCRSAFIPALCNLYRLKNCSNDTYTSVIAEHKVHFFNLLSHYQFPIPATWVYDRRRGWLGGEPPHAVKLIAKPAYECASIGIGNASVSVFDEAFFKHVKDLSEALLQPVLVQAFIEGYEVEVPVFDIGEPFAPMSVGIDMNGAALAGRDFLTYEQVYADRYSFYSFCRRMPEQGAKLRAIAQNTFTTLGLSGLVRVDFRVNECGAPVIIDYNNAPHLTAFHSCARAVMDLGFEYGDMLSMLLYKHIPKGAGAGLYPTARRRVRRPPPRAAH